MSNIRNSQIPLYKNNLNMRDALQLHPGQKMKVIEYNGRIELIPDRDISELVDYH